MASGRDNLPPNHIQFWHRTDKKKPDKSAFFWPREKAEQPMGEAASNAADNAKAAAVAALPQVTSLGIAMLSKKDGYLPLAPLGVPVTIGGIVIDTLKAPFCLVIATEEAVRAGITKVFSLMFEKSPDQAITDRLFKSFLIRMRETASLLVALELENPDVLNKKLKSGDIEDLVGLTLLHTAYASRYYPNGLMLATNKTLLREDCPVEGLVLFDKIMQVKQSIRTALQIDNSNVSILGNPARELEESRIVCNWIKLIKIGKPIVLAERPDFTASQIEIVNNIITQIAELKRIGMAVLPKSPAAIAREIPRPTR